MKKIIKKISRVVQVVLLAPVKLPAKAMSILKYVAVGLGIVESVLGEEDKDKEPSDCANNQEAGLGDASSGKEGHDEAHE